MFQIRLHGRGGQGVVTSAEMLSLAAFTEGHYAQAFPSFGSERTGAPVVAFARVSDHQIRLREPITERYLSRTVRCLKASTSLAVSQITLTFFSTALRLLKNSVWLIL